VVNAPTLGSDQVRLGAGWRPHSAGVRTREVLRHVQPLDTRQTALATSQQPPRDYDGCGYRYRPTSGCTFGCENYQRLLNAQKMKAVHKEASQYAKLLVVRIIKGSRCPVKTCLRVTIEIQWLRSRKKSSSCQERRVLINLVLSNTSIFTRALLRVEF
jgi:hypothetical protein